MRRENISTLHRIVCLDMMASIREAMVLTLKTIKAMLFITNIHGNRYHMLVPQFNGLMDNSKFRKIMKVWIVTLFIFFTSIGLIYATPANSQPIDKVEINLELNNESLLKAFRKIEAQTVFHFMYRDEDVNGIRNLNIPANRKSVEAFLKDILAKTSLSYKQVDQRILILNNSKIYTKTNVQSASISNQLLSVYKDIVVRGHVTDSKGESLRGASVRIKGDPVVGSTTDTLGRYVLTVPDNSALVFSYVGYVTKEIQVNNQTTINVNLQAESNSLDAIVVVGYGTQKRGDITGAISSVSPKTLREVPVTSAPQLLQGTVAGVYVTSAGNKPGSGVTVQIRGKRSFSAGNDPLYVVDGIPISGNLNEINPSDIESMDILKDASATAIYGSRGANGVITITTKRGKLGRTTVSYDSYFGVAKIMKYIDVMNGAEFAEYKRESRRSVINPSTGKPTYDDTDPTADAKLFIEAVELNSIKSGRSTDWQKLMIQTGFSQNHSLNISGGTENTRYNISLGVFNDKGIIKNQDFTRYTTRINLDQNIGTMFKVGVSSLGAFSKQNNGSNPYNEALQQSPLGVPYDTSGKLVYFPNNDNRRFNPVADLVPGAVLNVTNRFRLLNNLYGEVNILDGLKFRMNVGIDLTNTRTGIFSGRYSLARGTGDPSANENESFNLAPIWENILTYNRTLHKKHNLGFTGLYSIQTNRTEASNLGVVGLPLESMEYYNFGAATTISGVGSSFEKWGITSYMARINYGFDSRFLVTLTGRADGSSKFAKGHQWGYFPSAALGWNITNEKFMNKNRLFSNLKLRVSYGKTGNEGIAPYQTNGLLSRTQYDFDGTAAYGYRPNTLRNNELKWESTASGNIGLDFGLFNNRISGTFEVYQSNTTDLLLPSVLPTTSGFASILTNVGSKRNRGIEAAISASIITAKSEGGFEWSADVNLFTNKEEITELSQGKVDDIGNARFIGQPATVYYDYVKLGIWQLGEKDNATKYSSSVGQIKVQDVNNNGTIDPGDRKILGSDVPNLIGGMTHRFGFKGFDLSILTFARFGSTIVSPLHSTLVTLAGKYNGLDVDYWTKDNPTNAYPQPVSTQEAPLMGTTLRYFDGSFVKIRNINLGYNFSPKLGKMIRAQSVRLYVSAQNPFIFSSYTSKYKGIDPENPITDTPIFRTFLGGINVKF